jgi:hypothetical protein
MTVDAFRTVALEPERRRMAYDAVRGYEQGRPQWGEFDRPISWALV